MSRIMATPELDNLDEKSDNKKDNDDEEKGNH